LIGPGIEAGICRFLGHGCSPVARPGPSLGEAINIPAHRGGKERRVRTKCRLGSLRIMERMG